MGPVKRMAVTVRQARQGEPGETGRSRWRLDDTGLDAGYPVAGHAEHDARQSGAARIAEPRLLAPVVAHTNRRLVLGPATLRSGAEPRNDRDPDAEGAPRDEEPM